MTDLVLSKKHKEIAILAGLALFFIFLGWVLAVEPSLVKIKRYERQIKDSRVRLDIIDEINALSKSESDNSQLFIKESERNEVLAKIVAILNEKKMDILTAEPSEMKIDAFDYFMITTDVSTKFMDLIGLLDGLKTLKTPLALRYVNMGQSSRASQSGATGAGGKKIAKLRFEGLMTKDL